MWLNLAIITILLIVVLVAAWRIRRYQRDIDYEEREYRDPPVFQWPEGPTL